MALAGYGGNIKVGTSAIVDMGEWSIDADVDLIDTTSFQDSWKRKTPGVKDATGSATGRWNVASGNQQEAIQNAYLNSTTVSLRFYVDASHYYSCTAYIKSISPKASVDGVVEQEFAWEADGALAYT